MHRHLGFVSHIDYSEFSPKDKQTALIARSVYLFIAIQYIPRRLRELMQSRQDLGVHVVKLFMQVRHFQLRFQVDLILNI